MIKKQQKTAGYSDTGDGLKRPPFNIVFAAEKNQVDNVKAALDYDPNCINNVDSKTKMSSTHFGCANASYELLSVLLDKKNNPKADLFLKDKFDRMPIDLALRNGDKKVVDLVLESMYSDKSKGIAAGHILPFGNGPKSS